MFLVTRPYLQVSEYFGIRVKDRTRISPPCVPAYIFEFAKTRARIDL